MTSLKTDTVFIVGNGTITTPSNALSVMSNGDTKIKGDVYIGCAADSTGGTKLATVNDLPAVPVQDVQVNGTSVLSNGVANIPTAANGNPGAVKVNSSGSYGLVMNSGEIRTYTSSGSMIKTGTEQYRPITPSNQHNSVFYGLAKAAGDTTQAQSDNAVGTYTDDAKSAIRTMLGAVGDTNYATSTTAGVIKVTDGSYGLRMLADGTVVIMPAYVSTIKTGTDTYRPIAANNANTVTFYGLAKAAGDTTQSSSSNTVGTYTAEAKAAIQTMLGVESGVSFVETISDTDVTITGIPNTRYVCNEVSTISITPPSAGTIIVRFTSGTTAAVLTLPSTVKMPDWWNGVSTNYIY